MQPNCNSLFRDAIFSNNIEAVSDLIKLGARLELGLFSHGEDLDDAAQSVHDENVTKLLTSFYAIFNKTPGSGGAENSFIQHCLDFMKQAIVLRSQLTQQGEILLDNLQDCCQETMLSKREAWGAALRDYSNLNMTAKSNPKDDLAPPSGQYKLSHDGKEKLVYESEDNIKMLRFAHRFIAHNRFTEPQKFCQGLLNFYALHPDSPKWLENIIVLLPSEEQPSVAAAGLSAAENPTEKKITLEMALRLCVDLVSIGLGFGRDAGSYTIYDACKEGRAAVVKLLLDHGADINAKDNGDTLLHQATYCKQIEVMQTLLTVEVIDINAKDNDGRTPLFWAVGEGLPKFVALLLAAEGIDINATDNDGKTPLHWAVHNVVHSYARGNFDEMPLHWAIDLGLGDEVDHYLRADFDETLFHRAAFFGQADAAARLFDHGIGIHAKDHSDRLRLHKAACERKTEVLERLLKHGADIHAKDHTGQTPLQLAESKNHTETVHLLESAAQTSVDLEGSGTAGAAAEEEASQCPDSEASGKKHSDQRFTP